MDEDDEGKPRPERERDPAKGRNKVRDMAAGAMSNAALTALILGVVRPLLDDDVPFRLTTSLGVVSVAIVLWFVASYVHRTTEKE